MSKYALAPEVHVCATEDHGVALDLKHDRYVGIEPVHMRVLARVIDHWPCAPLPSEDDCDGREAQELIDRFVANGLIVEDATSRATFTRYPAIERPIATLLDYWPTGNPRATASHLTTLAVASVSARASLRLLTMSTIVERVRRRKARAQKWGQASMDDASNLVFIFFRIAPLFLSEQNRCLLSSLTLVEFLARHHVFAEWVFGVQTRPFGAHCWVQLDRIVLNDTSDRVMSFTPIMAV